MNFYSPKVGHVKKTRESVLNLFKAFFFWLFKFLYSCAHVHVCISGYRHPYYKNKSIYKVEITFLLFPRTCVCKQSK